MNGWRRRIGVVAPVGSHVDALYNQYAPDGIAFDGVGLPVPEMSVQGLRELIDRAENGVAAFRGQTNKMILFGSQSASFLDNEGCRERLEQASGLPVLTAADALQKAIEAIGARQVVVMTPYEDEVNALARDFLEKGGTKVLSVTGIGMNNFTEFAYPDLRFLYRSARKLDMSGADAFVICGMVYETLELIHALEADLRLPVLTAQQTSLWACLRHAGMGDDLSRQGRLFQY